MAQLCGVDRRTLSRWERGASTPSASAAVVLQALQVHGLRRAVRRWAEAGGLGAIVAHATGRERKNDGTPPATDEADPEDLREPDGAEA
jgi:transcriptional regulator with XRE-family HTH domain